MSPRINPATGGAQPLPQATARLKPNPGVASADGIQAAKATVAVQPAAQQAVTNPPRPLKANPGIERPLPTEETPLLPEQAAFQLPDAFVQDVQQVASQAGFVGLSARAIQRAYLQGEGLFVDMQA